jgi:hypothetical protein
MQCCGCRQVVELLAESKREASESLGKFAKLVGMDSSDLTPEQLNQVFAKLAPIAHYLARVKARMIEKDFPPDDELFQMVEKAHAQAHAAAMKVHELVGGGLPQNEG